MQPINPAAIRYIKLGEGGRWADASIDRGEMHFGFSMIPHEVALAGDWDAVARQFVAEGRSAGTARSFIREIEAFHTLGPDCLWITFARGHLWWGFAEPEIHWLGGADGNGLRMRRMIGGWCNRNIAGEPLNTDGLSTRLTKLAAYRRTICSVQETDYLLRRINGIKEPILIRAASVRADMLAVTSDAIERLHWADFETMVDLIFTRSGWQRLSRLGGTQKDIDLLIEQPTTKETGFVQVKSQASQAVLDDYLERFDASGAYHRMFFVCHSPNGNLDAGGRDDVHLWTRGTLAEAAIKTGLYDWLMEKVA